MSDPTSSQDQRSEHLNRGRGFQQNRPSFRARGRGRGRGETFYVQRTLQELGVSDLREHLDRKHQIEHGRNVPPSDPSYNYLRDPMRDGENYSPRSSRNLRRSNSYSSRGSRARVKNQETSYIENPSNIKVEFSIATGQRNYSLNEDSSLPNIKHIPDYEYHDTKPRGGKSIRARGRSRYVESGTERTLRAKSSERKYEENIYEYRGNPVRSRSVEGRGEASGEFRGRGNYRGRTSRPRYQDDDSRGRSHENKTASERGRSSGRGRSRGRGNRRGRGGQHAHIPHTDLQSASTEVTSEESWDDATLTDVPVELKESSNKAEEEQPFEKNDDKVQCETETNYELSENPDDVNDDENNEEDDQSPENKETFQMDKLVVTSSIKDKNKKRTVRFSLNEDEENNSDNSKETKEDNNEESQVTGEEKNG